MISKLATARASLLRTLHSIQYIYLRWSASALSLPTDLQCTLPAFNNLTTWRPNLRGKSTFTAFYVGKCQPSSTFYNTIINFPPVNHISTKTKQAIFWCSEDVEFDLLLPENLSLLTNNELTGLSKSVSRKQVELPNPRKKMHVDSMDKWLSTFTIHYRIIRFADLLGSPMTLIYVRKRLEIFPSIEENKIPNFILWS